MWMDDTKKFYYLTVALTFIKDKELKTRLLFTTKFSEEKKTVENIGSEIFRQLDSLGVEQKYARTITIVTNQNSVLTKALKNCPRMDCASYLLNSVLRNTFE